MKLRTLWSAALVLALFSGATAGPALASGTGPKLKTLVFIGKDRHLNVLDLGAAGSSPGDVRTLNIRLTTAGNEHAGILDGVQYLAEEGAIDRGLTLMVFALPKGHVMVQGLLTFDDFSSTSSRPDDAHEAFAIVGGTGRFVGAKGTVDMFLLPNLESRWTLHFQ